MLTRKIEKEIRKTTLKKKGKLKPTHQKLTSLPIAMKRITPVDIKGNIIHCSNQASILGLKVLPIWIQPSCHKYPKKASLSLEKQGTTLTTFKK